MKKEEFRSWMVAQGYKPSSVSTLISDANKVDGTYNLDTEFDRDECETLLHRLAYSAADAAASKPNETGLNLSADLVRDLSHLRSTTRAYVRFRKGENAPAVSFVLIDSDGVRYRPSFQRNSETGALAYRVKPKGASNRAEDARECATLDEFVVAVLLEHLPGRFEPVNGGSSNYLKYGTAKLVSYEADPALADRLDIPTSLSAQPPLKPALWFVTARDGDADGVNRFVSEGMWSLLPDMPRGRYNEQVEEMEPGDRIVLRHASNQANGLPFDAKGESISVMRIRAVGTVLARSEDGLRVPVQWDSTEERFWYFFNSTKTIWRPKDGHVCPAKLRAFILEGEQQDYDWFLTHPFWDGRINGAKNSALSKSQDTASEKPGETEMAKPTNLVLYGPPGTGKTYRTAREAVLLCDGRADFSEDADGRAALMDRYAELVRKERIGFVTFHQNFSYEDFVEGLRPSQMDEDGQQIETGFRLAPEPGIFRAMSERAEKLVSTRTQSIPLDGRKVYKMSLGEVTNSADDYLFDEAIEGGFIHLGGDAGMDWSQPGFDTKRAMLQGYAERHPEAEALHPNHGLIDHTFTLRNRIEPGDLVVITKGNLLFRAIGEVTGDYHQVTREDDEYTMRRPVRWLWVDRDGQSYDLIYGKRFSQKTVYELSQSELKGEALSSLISGEDSQGETQQFVLIIDEINRANISKVFGELITLLEPDKRLGQPNALKVRLPYSKKEFGVPSNLHVIGTMNTADRSIALLDTALRRRFRFEEIAPDPGLLDTVDGIALPKVLTVINERIEYLIDRDHRIGHAFFMGDGGKDRAAIDATMRDKVIPLLQEYFFEDWSRIASVVGDGFLVSKTLKAPPGLGDLGTRESWSVRATFLPDAYDRLLKGSMPNDGPEQPDIDDEYDEA